MADSTRPDDALRYATLAQLGLEMVAPIGLGLLLDYQFGTMPWLTVAGAVLGFAGGMVHLVSVLGRKGRQDRA